VVADRLDGATHVDRPFPTSTSAINSHQSFSLQVAWHRLLYRANAWCTIDRAKNSPGLISSLGLIYPLSPDGESRRCVELRLFRGAVRMPQEYRLPWFRRMNDKLRTGYAFIEGTVVDIDNAKNNWLAKVVRAMIVRVESLLACIW
jgi:hypothetical protein